MSLRGREHSTQFLGHYLNKWQRAYVQLYVEIHPRGQVQFKQVPDDVIGLTVRTFKTVGTSTWLNFRALFYIEQGIHVVELFEESHMHCFT